MLKIISPQAYIKVYREAYIILVAEIKPQLCKSVLMLKIISPQAYIKVYREAYIIFILK